MLETKEQKQIFFGSLGLVLILAVISFWPKHNSPLANQPVKNQSQDVLNSKAYLDYLRSIPTDPKASQQLFQTIITQDEIRQEVENKLQVNQQIVAPQIDDKKFKTTANTDQAINSYLSDTVSQAYSFNTNTQDLAKNLFSGGQSTAGQLAGKLDSLSNQLYKIPVPKDALPLHKSLITAYAAYRNLLESAKNFDPGGGVNNDAIWPEVYKNYVIANDSTKNYSDELNQLAGKYKIAYVSVNYYADSGASSHLGNIFVPEAKAFLGLSFNFTIGDIPRIIMDAVKEGLTTSFLNFMGTMLNNLIGKIEKNYAIANFLYYSDALVNGQYTDDYLNKYVSDQLDRNVIKKLIPQFNCGQNQNLKPIFAAKASEHLGFDPDTLDVNDPNYYQKLASVGDFLSSPQGWETYYQDVASQAESQAQKAVDQELSSSGLKTPRDSVNSSIATSINAIISSERASFTSLLQLGINNASSLISNVVASLTQNLVNKFVFQGATTNSGNIVVFKEQPTCLSAALLTPVLPLPPTQYQQPPAPPTAQAAIASQCSLLNTLSDDCTTAIMGELAICANSPAQHTGTLSCSMLAQSVYVQALRSHCSSFCSVLQGYLQSIP